MVDCIKLQGGNYNDADAQEGHSLQGGNRQC